MSVWRRGAALTALCLVLVLAALLVVRVWSQRRLAAARVAFEAELGPLDPASYNRPEIAAHENPARWFAAAGAALVLDPAESDVLRAAAAEDDDWSDGFVLEVESVLSFHAPALALAERARGLEASSWELDYTACYELRYDGLMPALKLSQLLQARSRLEAQGGATAAAVDDLLLLLELASSLRREPGLIPQLLGFDVEGSALRLLRRLLPELGPEATAAVEAALRRLRGGAEPVSTSFVLDGVCASAATVQAAAGTPFGRIFLGWQQDRMLAQWLDFYRALAISARGSLQQFEIEAQGRRRNIVSDMLFPNLRDVVFKAKTAEAAEMLALVALGAHRHRLEEGEFPAASLLALGPNPVDDQPLQYEIGADGAAVLSLPTVAEMWQERGSAGGRPPPPLEWRLPR